MLLEALQSSTKTLLEAHPFFAGFTWIIEDGETDNREAAVAALKAKGIYGTIQPAQYGDVLEQHAKMVYEQFYLPVTISEFPDFNRNDDAGFGYSAEQCSTEVIKALLPVTPPGQHQAVGRYSLLEGESRRYLGTTEGAHVWLVNLAVKITTATT